MKRILGAMRTSNTKWWYSVPCLVLFFACTAWMGFHGPIGQGGYLFIAVFVLANLCLVGLWAFWPLRGGSAGAIFVLAVAARALMFPFPLGDDVNRYLWEGKIQNAGFNPFRLAPDSPEVSHLRDENWDGINQKHLPALHPPAAQITFRLCHGIWPDKRCLRLVFTVFDLSILLVLFALARTYGVARRHLLLYALSPLVLLYVAGEGHLEPISVFFLMAALWAAELKRRGTALFLLGLGAMFKLVPLLFLPLFLRQGNTRMTPLFFLPFLLAVPFVLDGTDMLEVPVVVAKTFFYNGFLFSILSLFLPYPAASMGCWILFCLLAGGILFSVPDLFRGCYLTAGAFLLCMPAAHQWYFILLVPFLPFFRSVPWLVLTVTVAATFATRIEVSASGEWIDFPLARCIEYGPFVLAGVWGILWGRRPGR